MFRRDRRSPPALADAHFIAGSAGPRRTGRPRAKTAAASCASTASPTSCTATAAAWSALAARPAAARHRREEWRALGGGLIQRARLLNLVLADLLRHAAAGARWLRPRAAGLRQSRLSARLPGHRRAGRCLSAILRRRSGALAGWPLVGDRGPHPGARRAGLCAGEPLRPLARSAGSLPRSAAASDRGLFAHPARHARAGSRRRTRTIRPSSCSRPARTTKPISSTPTSRATSASRWWKAMI